MAKCLLLLLVDHRSCRWRLLLLLCRLILVPTKWGQAFSLSLVLFIFICITFYSRVIAEAINLLIWTKTYSCRFKSTHVVNNISCILRLFFDPPRVGVWHRVLILIICCVLLIFSRVVIVFILKIVWLMRRMKILVLNLFHFNVRLSMTIVVVVLAFEISVNQNIVILWSIRTVIFVPVWLTLVFSLTVHALLLRLDRFAEGRLVSTRSTCEPSYVSALSFTIS
jgi:hypothetical protein